MGVRFRRLMGTADELQPGEFTTNVGPMLVGQAVICCPLCGGVDTLGDRYTIDKAGRVVPAFACGGGCSFHDWIELDGLT